MNRFIETHKQKNCFTLLIRIVIHKFIVLQNYSESFLAYLSIFIAHNKRTRIIYFQEMLFISLLAVTIICIF